MQERGQRMRRAPSVTLRSMRVFHSLAFAACTAALLALGGCGTSRPPSTSSSSSAPIRTTPPLTAEQAHDIAIHAIGLVGTPYRYGGNTPDSGFDCSGLIGYVYRDAAGINLPRSTRELIAMPVPSVRREALQTGDLVFFATAGGGRVSHPASML